MSGVHINHSPSSKKVQILRVGCGFRSVESVVRSSSRSLVTGSIYFQT